MYCFVSNILKWLLSYFETFSHCTFIIKLLLNIEGKCGSFSLHLLPLHHQMVKRKLQIKMWYVLWTWKSIIQATRMIMQCDSIIIITYLFFSFSFIWVCLKYDSLHLFISELLTSLIFFSLQSNSYRKFDFFFSQFPLRKSIYMSPKYSRLYFSCSISFRVQIFYHFSFSLPNAV